jgi:uncharacterized delta-60 repeat protein
LAVRPDGKILVGGVLTHLADQPRQNFGRLNPDGSVDAGFSPRAEGDVHTIALQYDAKIIIGGSFFVLNGDPQYFGIARLNADGSVDSGFNTLAGGGRQSRSQ